MQLSDTAVLVCKECLDELDAKAEQVQDPLEQYIGMYLKKRWETEGRGERMWVEIQSVEGNFLIGVLSQDPVITPGIQDGDPVKMHRGEVIGVYRS